MKRILPIWHQIFCQKASLNFFYKRELSLDSNKVLFFQCVSLCFAELFQNTLYAENKCRSKQSDVFQTNIQELLICVALILCESNHVGKLGSIVSVIESGTTSMSSLLNTFCKFYELAATIPNRKFRMQVIDKSILLYTALF